MQFQVSDIKTIRQVRRQRQLALWDIATSLYVAQATLIQSAVQRPFRVQVR